MPLYAKKIDTVIRVHMDGYYLPESQACSQAEGNLFLGSKNFDQSDNNGAIITISQIIKNVMASASEAGCASLFINTREAVVVRTTL